MRALILAFLFAAIPAQASAPLSAYDAVNPFIGTAAGGNTFPGATLPFGMIQWSPDTRSDGWYHYDDKTIRGFSLTHISGAGCPIYADVPILPWIGDLSRGPGSEADYVLPFSHSNEEAHPGYYAVRFDNGVRTELTVSTRAGIGRFSFPPDVGRTLLFKAGDSATSGDANRSGDASTVQIRGRDMVAGSVHSGGFCGSDSNYVLYFVARFSSPFSSFGVWTDIAHAGARSATGHKAGAFVSFPASAEPLLLKVGISFVSIENAAANLKAEIQGWDFDTVRSSASSAWKEMLGRVRAAGGTRDERVNFYTALYHMLLSPNTFSDTSGDYIGFDGRVHRLARGQRQYANFSDWDIYRDVVQFQSLLFPERASQMMQSLLRDAEQSGWLPRWPVAADVSYVMGGDSPSILLSTAYAFGARSFDTKSALHFMLKSATEPGVGLHGQSERPHLAEYLSKGYIFVRPGDRESAASVTLEYADSDFAISRFAAAMGDRKSAADLLGSSQNWRKLFDEGSGFIRPRTSDGQFLGNWDPDHLSPHHTRMDTANQLGFEEGSAWQYTWMIPHNYAGLFRAMGGNDKVLPKLDRFFQKLSGWGLPNFTVTNEPDFCAAYAYMWTGRPWETQKVVDRIRRETFAPGPSGLPGNDDLGATSGVYVWNALGMYPVIPGVGGLVLGTPMFSRVSVRLGAGKRLEIMARGKGIYVSAVELNHREHPSSWLPVNSLSAADNRLVFGLTAQPSHGWGVAPESFPPSFDVPGK